MREPEPSSDAPETLLAFAVGEPVEPPDSVLVVVAHPDDEVIGAGTLLRRLTAAGVCIDLIHVTDGAPRNMADAHAAGFADAAAYARHRRRELDVALRSTGIHVRSATSLDVPDQQASFRLESIARRLGDTLCALCPAVVLTHAYEGGHPDHDATAFAVHAARNLLHTRSRPEHTATHGTPVVELCSYNGAGGGFRAPHHNCATIRACPPCHDATGCAPAWSPQCSGRRR